MCRPAQYHYRSTDRTAAMALNGGPQNPPHRLTTPTKSPILAHLNATDCFERAASSLRVPSDRGGSVGLRYLPKSFLSSLDCAAQFNFSSLHSIPAPAMACKVMMSTAVTVPLPAHAVESTQQQQPMMPMHLGSPPCSLAFVYGTLKRGFSNHWLIEDVVGGGHAQFLGTVRTKQRYPLVCGPFQVPFLLNMPNSGLQVKGELYAVDQSALALLDDLEGVSKGHYQRRPLVLTDEECSSEILAEAYFAFPTLQGGLSSAPHIDAYTKKETVDYVYRKDRPKNRTFLQHVEHWIEAQGPRSYICV